MKRDFKEVTEDEFSRIGGDRPEHSRIGAAPAFNRLRGALSEADSADALFAALAAGVK